VVEHAAESTERDISWLDRLIDAERTRASAGSTGSGPAARAPQATDLDRSLIQTEGSST
jgi:hypothetical protein